MPSYQLRPVGLEFLEKAPTRLEFAHEVRGRAPVVFGAISADPSTWSWFPGLSEGSYEGPPPHGKGSRRRVRMAESIYIETILLWEEPTRWSYRVDETSDPIADALVEDWFVEERGEISIVRWTFAIDPGPVFQGALPGASEVVGGVFSEAMGNLSALLSG